MEKDVFEFFREEKIEYFREIDFRALSVINEPLLSRSIKCAKSALIFLVPYFTGYGENLSAYAVSLDYHAYLKDLTERLIMRLKEIYPNNSFVGFGDHSPINERLAATMAGLGIFGKNGLLINEKYGSFIFIGEIISDLEPSECAVRSGSVKSCSDCGACIGACPVGALSGSEECLSAITQKKGDLTDGEKQKILENNTVWGCDICQRVCPYNQSAEKTPINFFYEKRITSLDTEMLDGMSDDEFKARAFAWRGRKTIRRNLEFIYNNTPKK